MYHQFIVLDSCLIIKHPSPQHCYNFFWPWTFPTTHIFPCGAIKRLPTPPARGVQSILSTRKQLSLLHQECFCIEPSLFKVKLNPQSLPHCGPWPLPSIQQLVLDSVTRPPKTGHTACRKWSLTKSESWTLAVLALLNAIQRCSASDAILPLLRLLSPLWKLPHEELPHVSPDHPVVTLFPTWSACLVHLHIKIFVKSRVGGRETSGSLHYFLGISTEKKKKKKTFRKTETQRIKWVGESPRVVSGQARRGIKVLWLLCLLSLGWLPKRIDSSSLCWVKFSPCRGSWSVKSTSKRQFSLAMCIRTKIPEEGDPSHHHSGSVNLSLDQWPNLIF